VVRALEWIVASRRSGARNAVRIDVVNLSLGHPIYEPAATDPLVRAVENAVRAGIVVVVAAGNHGQEADGSAGYAGVTSPGNAPSAITVGAADTRQTAGRSDDRIAVFSSRGPTWFDAFAKPDVVAPGVALAAEAADGAQLYLTYPSLKVTVKHRNYGRLSGSSVATATAAGVVALVLEASREANDGRALTPNAVKAVLQYTAIPVAGADALSQGSGQVNGRGALALAALIDPTMPAGQWWLRTPVLPFSSIAGHLHAWSRTIVWNDSAIRGADAIFLRSQLWDDNIVWGSGCDTDEAHCLTSVWGAAAEADNIVWGSGLAWAEDLVYADRVIGLLAGDNIVWGTLAGLRADNIVWGTILDADNIVWGTLRGDNIVWGTLNFAENIVWGTLRGDNIVWGTLSGGAEGGRQ
jgi:serine protease AprX